MKELRIEAEVIRSGEIHKFQLFTNFQPEELKVSIEGHVLTIEGAHEIHDDDQYLKRYVLSFSFN